ncbi:MAG: ribosome maturation factor RimM [Methylococcaceae bacterium]|nr:ribosome maturation factor RimM [Methylococcaceae bacterium]
MDDPQYLTIGKISGVFGIKGAVKVFSYTDPRENILNYPVWILRKHAEIKVVNVLGGQAQGKTIVATLAGTIDPNKAAELNGWEILIERSQLPPVAADEYYWADLEGLSVVTTLGVPLGIVDYLLDTGANDVLVVKGDRERLIPFLKEQTIHSVDLDKKLIVVDWDPDF